MSNMQMQNYGYVVTSINNNGNKNDENIEWSGEYDGNKANVDLKHLSNGISNYYHVELNNDDIKNILGTQPNMQPLEQRLIQDFNMPMSLERMFKKSRRKHRHNKITKNKRTKNKKSKRRQN